MPRLERSARAAGSVPAPDNLAWLAEQVERTPLLPDPRLRAAWRTLLPWLTADQRYELAAALRAAEVGMLALERERDR